jgi:hypothetical protein
MKQLTVPVTAEVDVAEEEPDEYEQVEVEVPYTYQEEVIEEREEIQEQMVQRKVPQVKAMYSYQGQGMAIDKGEVSWLSLFYSLTFALSFLQEISRLESASCGSIFRNQL